MILFGLPASKKNRKGVFSLPSLVALKRPEASILPVCWAYGVYFTGFSATKSRLVSVQDIFNSYKSALYERESDPKNWFCLIIARLAARLHMWKKITRHKWCHMEGNDSAQKLYYGSLTGSEKEEAFHGRHLDKSGLITGVCDQTNRSWIQLSCLSLHTKLL